MKGVVRVKLQSELVPAVKKAKTMSVIPGQPLQVGVSSLDESLTKIKGVSMRPLFPCAPDREAEHAKYGLNLWYEITFDESVNPLEAKRIMQETAGIQRANARVPMSLRDNPSRYRVLNSADVAPTALTAMPFNDPRLSLQWHYNNDGSMNGSRAGADINLFKAWQMTTGSNNVVVAIIDGGIDYNHEDLAGAMWINQAELNGKPGVDDDGDGYIDDIYGYNFCTYNGEIYPHTHGTHVAGTVGAINNNGKGVAGVAGGNGTSGSGVRLMSCQVFDSRSGAGDGDFAAALIYAADKGATIAQCSWGWDGDGYYEQDVIDAIHYFTNSARSNNMTGGLCIFAAGNTGSTGMFYPGCLDEVVAVGAICYDLSPASYSSYGSWVDVSAPGGLLDYDNAQGVLSTLPDNTYGYSEGTSMATPHVSGIAALILSKYGSPALVNETLRRQLVTSVNDLYALYPKAEGLYGAGYIDAWKALQWGDGTAPEKVTDLRAVAAQDNVLLSWTIPASSDNNVNSHIIYYSDKPFTASNTEGCKTEIIDTKFNSSGDPFSHEISGLEALTTYYFGIVAIDRWSNVSEMSEIVTATTNEGPKMTLSRTAMNIRCTDGNEWTSGTFDIGNTASGLLKWNAYMRTFSSAISSYNTAKGLMTAPFSGQISGLAATPASTTVKDIEDFQRDDYPQEFTNCSSLYAFIGDSDIDLTNSMAQLFTVDAAAFPKGFNLTHITIEGGYGKNPVIEIYRNTGTLNNATLLGTTNITNESPYYTDLALAESIFFNAGESFYVVVHFKEASSPNFPLGLGVSNGNAAAAHAYMSTDLGQTWSLLSEVLKGTSYESMADKCVWDIKVKSKFPDWSQVLTLTPSQGQLEGGGTNKQTVTVSHNGTKIPNGTYRARILFDTNESNPSGKTINVNMTVAGNEPQVSFNKILQFGNVLVGQKKVITVEVANTGYGSFAGGTNFAGIYSDKIRSTSDQFLPPDYLLNGIPSRSSATFDITYAPTKEGNHYGQIIINDIDGRELVINVQGAATEPAKISASPQTVEVGDLDAFGDNKEVSFSISNEGNYPLQWVMPKFSNETVEGLESGSTHRFGYSWQANLYGSDQVSYSPAPTIVDATDVSSQLGDYDYFSDPIDLGFQFPFYGKTYEQVYISSMGMLTFDTYTEGAMYSPMSEDKATYLAGLGVISAYGYELGIAPDTRIEYGTSDGKFVVNFKNVLATVYAEETIPVSFHIILSPSGDIEMGYDDYTPTSVFENGKNLWVGIVDPDMDDPLTLTSTNLSAESVYRDNEDEQYNRWKFVKTGTTVLFAAPRPDMIKSIAPTSGIVMPNSSVNVKATVGATEEMYIGPTSTNLVIQSNDVTNPTYIVKFNANIIGDLKAVFDLSAESIDFGKVFRTAEARKSVSVQNHGRNYLTLESVSIAGGKFTHNFEGAVSIAPGQSKDVTVILPTENEGAVSDVMTITTSEGTKTVNLTGEVIGVPAVKLSYESLEETIPYGESRPVPLTVTNTGNEPLSFSITAGAHLTYSPKIATDANVSYAYVSSLDDPSAKREWVDIETTGLGKQFNYTYFLNRDQIAVDLPFEFSYYGRKYTKMYIFNSGFVSFTERNDEGVWPTPPNEFPDGSLYNNLIAPYWGLHTMDITATAGIYYYVSESEAVVSFIEYGNSMNIGVDFQVVLRADGSFTFNYKPATDYATIYGAFGVAGISDTENKGIRLPERYICLNSSINFSPVVECVVEPGMSRKADIKVLADELAGRYTSKISVATNIPTAPVVEIPVTINITGQPAPVFPEDFTVEQVSQHQDTNYADELIGYYGAMWYIPLEVRNEGAAAFTIDAIDVESPLYQGNKIFELYWYGITTDWLGSPTTGWTVYKNESINVGKSIVRFAIPFTSANYSAYAWQTPGTYDVKLTFHLSGVEGVTTKTVNVKIVITEQPEIALDKEEIRITDAEDSQIETRQLTVANTDGKSRLTYTITVDPTGVGEESSDVSFASLISPAESGGAIIGSLDAIELPKASVDGKIKPSAVGVPEFLYDAPQGDDFTYRRALYWPALSSSTVVYNYGAGNTYSTYKAATAYTGPEGGFNISHIYTCIHPYLLNNKDVTVEIYGCDPQTGDDVLGRGTYNIGEVTSGLYQNKLVTIQLDRSVFISEGQQFWVVITYPTGQNYPAGIIVKEESVQSNRYMGYVDSYGWFDMAALFNDQYGSLGYICSCIETVEGGSWVKLLDSDNNTSLVRSSEIAAGASEDILLQISPVNASKEKGNKAVLVIKSNDPKMPLINFPVFLDKNGSPAITAPKTLIAVEEGKTVTVNATVVDPEGENLTIYATDNGRMTRILSASSIDGSGIVKVADDGMDVTVTDAPGGAKITFEIAPDYGTDGSYTLSIFATDARGHESQAAVNYRVTHVNRAPVALDFADISLALGERSGSIELASLFSDPDGDDLTCSYTVDNAGLIRVYSADGAIIIESIANGRAKVTVTATDPTGATATNSFYVNSGSAGIDGITIIEGINIYPNPVVETLYIDSEEDVDCRLYTMSGVMLLNRFLKAEDGRTHALSVGTLPAGLYLLKATGPAGRTASKIIIKK